MNSAKLNKTIFIISVIVIVAALAALTPKVYHAIRVAHAPKIEGAWQGTVTAGPSSLRGVLRRSPNPMASIMSPWTALMSAPPTFQRPNSFMIIRP